MTPEMSPQETPSAIGQIALNVHDVDRAVGFYRDVLGLDFLFDAPGMAFFDCGGVRLMLARPDKPEYDHPASIVYYRVADVRAAHAALSERGASFDSEPLKVHEDDRHELWMAFLKDTEGNPLALMAEVAKR